MNQLKILLYCFLCWSMACTVPTKSKPEKKPPNILILLADDLGYGDLGSYGGISHTPNLDRLAKQGIRFTDFYAAAPNCSPSRTGLLTGRSPSKVGMYNYLSENHPMHLKEEEITIAEVVKTKGYRTGHFGKWHVSQVDQGNALKQPIPADQGFDYSLGTANNAHPSHLNPVNFVRNGQAVGEMQGYSCDIVVDEAIDWLTEKPNGSNPFLMYVAFHEPHKKVASPPALTAKYDEYTQQNAEYFANVENMDKAVGRLLQVLDSLQLMEETFIVFASDNGSYRNGSNGELLGGKSFVYEGGIRVPGIIHWKGHIAGNQIMDEPASLIDLMPTISELAGATHPDSAALDGVSLLPLFAEKPLNRHRPLSWFFYRTTPEMAMRIGDYTILGIDRDSTRHTHPTTQPDMDYIKTMGLEGFELYNLKEDIGQAQNIDYTTLKIGQAYKAKMIKLLQEIQKEGPYWDNLPPATNRTKLKSEWRKLRPTGFSN